MLNKNYCDCSKTAHFTDKTLEVNINIRYMSNKGEKNNGFDVLYHNMKYGLDASKEFSDFLRESWIIEETYSKLQLKLAAKIATSYGSKGSFCPYWQLLRTFIEKTANVHQQLVTSWQEQFKDVQKYAIEQQKTHKEVKDNETSTMETVQGIQQTIALLQKAKESYHARCVEYEKMKRENTSSKDLDKVEAKYKKANDEYRAFIDKYSNVRNDFEARMTEACKRFQEVEENHLQQMRLFVGSYVTAWNSCCSSLIEARDEFENCSSELTVDKLIDSLVQSKTTGTQKPGPIEMEDADLSVVSPTLSTPDLERRDAAAQERTKKEGPVQRFPILIDTANHVSDFLTKRKRKKKKEDKDKDTGQETDLASSEMNTGHLDEDGFTVRPDNPLNTSCDCDSWYSTSDSESDTEDRKVKLKVEIKPASPSIVLADNVSDIRNLIKGLHITGTPTRRTPVAENIIIPTSTPSDRKPSQDLWDLDIFGNTPSTGACHATGSYKYPSPISGWAELNFENLENSTSSSVSSAAAAGRLSIGSAPPVVSTSSSALLSQRSSRSTLPYSSSQAACSTSSADQSLTRIGGTLERSGSIQSLSQAPFNTSFSFGLSHGHSAMSAISFTSETVPLAVAFCETVHAYFSGSGSETRCRLKITGQMIVSFPSGIVQALRNNPWSTALSLHVKNISYVDEILMNKQLISEATDESISDGRVFSFNMLALVDHLEQQLTYNRLASYFNIDTLKYRVRARHSGTLGAPLQLRSYWKFGPQRADFRLDYTYNGSAMFSASPLSNVSIHVPVNSDVKKMQCKPPGTWCTEKKRAVWNVGNISDLSENGVKGCVRAKFDLGSTPSGPHLAALSFTCQGTTMSGVNLELLGSGYRTSLIKKRIVSGKYVSEAVVS